MTRLEKQFDILMGELRGTGLSGTAAADNPGVPGLAPGPGGGKPGPT